MSAEDIPFERDHLFGLLLAYAMLHPDKEGDNDFPFHVNLEIPEVQFFDTIKQSADLCSTCLTTVELTAEEAREVAYAAGYFDALAELRVQSRLLEEQCAKAA